MMDNSVCMALVPYKGSYRHASLLERIFAKRRWLYFFLLPLTVASAFSGTYYYAVYAANGVSVPFAAVSVSVTSQSPASKTGRITSARYLSESVLIFILDVSDDTHENAVP